MTLGLKWQSPAHKKRLTAQSVQLPNHITWTSSGWRQQSSLKMTMVACGLPVEQRAVRLLPLLVEWSIRTPSSTGQACTGGTTVTVLLHQSGSHRAAFVFTHRLKDAASTWLKLGGLDPDDPQHRASKWCPTRHPVDWIEGQQLQPWLGN